MMILWIRFIGGTVSAFTKGILFSRKERFHKGFFLNKMLTMVSLRPKLILTLVFNRDVFEK